MDQLEYTIVNNKDQFDFFISELNSQSEYAFDLESNGLVTHGKDTQIVGIGFSWKQGKAYYIPFNGEILPEYILANISTAFENESINKIGHNIKFDTRLLDRFGIKVRGIYFDTMVANYCINGDRTTHNLDDLTLHFFNHVKIRTKTLIPKKSKKNQTPSMLDSSVDMVGTYCCEDVDFTYRLYKLLHELLDRPGNEHCKKLFYTIDMPLVSVLTKIECAGTKVSTEKLEYVRQKISVDIEAAQQVVDTLAGRPIVLTKPADISKLLFEDLKLHINKKIDVEKTATGQFSTDAATLKKFEGDPIVDAILKYKLLTKIMSTYVVGLGEHISEHTGFIHTFYGQTSTSTGRFNSSSPNLQQLPSRKEQGKEIREAFVSRFPGGKILAVDYSQAELRILAHMGQEKVFIKAYQNKEDVHTSVASEVVFEVPRDKVTPEQRTIVKTINFGLLYGMRAKKLAKTLNISVEEATAIMEKYMAKMIGLKKFLDNARSYLAINGYTENFFGRRRYIPKIFSNDQLDQWSAEREGANNIIQSTNADIIKIAMIRIQDMLERNRYKTKMIMQVHDELVFDVPADEIDTVKNKIVDIMQSVVSFDIMMVAEAKYGDNWKEAH